MRQDHRFQRKDRLSEKQKRMLPVILVPLIVIILMIIIVSADHAQNKKNSVPEPPSSAQEIPEPESTPEAEEQEADAAGESETDASEPETTEEEPETVPAEPSVLQRDSVPEIRTLIEEYYEARATADAEAINRIYGAGEVPAYMLEIQKVQLANNAKYLSGIDNVVTYVAGEPVSDGWLVYSTADLKFYSAETSAPMIMWCYVNRDADGNYHIADNEALSEEALQYVDKMNRSWEVRQLASDVNNRLKEALSSDEALNEIYGILRDGSPVWAGEGETEPEVVILEQETEIIEETETTEESESAEEAEPTEESESAEETEATEEPENEAET